MTSFTIAGSEENLRDPAWRFDKLIPLLTGPDAHNGDPAQQAPLLGDTKKVCMVANLLSKGIEIDLMASGGGAAR